MKNLLIILLIFLNFSGFSQETGISAADSIKTEEREPIFHKRECESLPLGMGLMLSGTTLIAMGCATDPYPLNAPFLKQGVRAQAIIVGAGLTVTGFIFTVAGY